MIVSLLFGTASYIAGVVSGVYMREHNVITVADIKKSADSIVASAKQLAAKQPKTQTQ